MTRILSFTLLSAFLCGHAPAQDHAEACKENLRVLSNGLKRYLIHTKGQLPGSIGQLYADGYVMALDAFVCPAAGVTVAREDEIDTKTSYALTDTLRGEKPLLLIRERHTNHAGQAHAFFSDYSIRTVPAPEGDRPPSRVVARTEGPVDDRPVIEPPDRPARVEEDDEDDPDSRVITVDAEGRITDSGDGQRVIPPPGDGRDSGDRVITIERDDRVTHDRPDPGTPERVRGGGDGAVRDPGSAFERGVEYYNAGKWEDARRQFALAVQQVPDESAFREGLAGALSKLGRMKEAETELRHAVRLTPEQASLHIGLCMALRAQGRWQEARKSAEAGVRLAPGDPETHYNLAQCLQGLQQWPQMEYAARQAIRLDATIPAYLDCLGTALLYQGKPAEAEKSYRAAVGKDLRNGWYRANYAGALLRLGLKDAARQQALYARQLGVRRHWVFDSLETLPAGER